MYNELENPTTAGQIEAPQEQTSANQPQQESQKEYNFRVMRDRAEAAERRAAEAERAAYEAKAAAGIELDGDDESYVERKTIKKLSKAQQEESARTRKEIEELKQQVAVSAQLTQLYKDCPDVKEIVTQENLELLKKKKPALHRSISLNPDTYEAGVSAYDAIKDYILSESKFASQDKKIEENKSKPRASGSIAPQVSETPLTRIDDYERRTLTEERREQLRKQVAEAKKFR